MKHLACLCAFIVAIVALIGVPFEAEAAKVLHRGNSAEPYSLDPHRAIATAEDHIISDMLIGLYTDDATGEPALGAAESVETSADGLTWTFKIRAHTWSDGVPVTAEDFAFAIRRLIDPNTAAEYASVLYPIKNAEKVNTGAGTVPVEEVGVRAPDARTLVIELEHPAPFLPELLTHYTTFPIPKHLVSKVGSDWTRPGTMVGNGPYTLAEWRPHDRVKLVKNPKFYDAANVKIDAVIYYPTDDDNAALKRYRAGELDTQERWPVNEYKWLMANIPNEAHRATNLTVQFISFNMSRKPFDDIRVRKALSEAIDRDVIVKDVYQGVYGQVADNFIPPGTANVDRSAKLPWAGMTMDERRAEAKALLAQAGYNEKRPLKFTYRYISMPDPKRAAVAMQAMWQDIGVQVELVATEAKVHWNLLQVRDFEVAHNAWVFDYNDAKNLFFQFQAAAVQMNNSVYNSPAFEKLLADADVEKDVATRAKRLGEAHALLLAELPAVPNFFPYTRHLVKPYVLNWNDNARDVNRTRWLDIGPGQGVPTADRDAGAQGSGSIWSWLASWFSAEAWSKWWNS
jgi:oligopeptide transport system substrate-binding protein